MALFAFFCCVGICTDRTKQKQRKLLAPSMSPGSGTKRWQWSSHSLPQGRDCRRKSQFHIRMSCNSENDFIKIATPEGISLKYCMMR